ncbi:MAG: hypothetical protein R3D27_14325 [Hyphomicrobiaceae bacterium]
MRTAAQFSKAAISTLGAMLVAIVGGCASSSDKIAAAYISPNQFQNYTCSQLGDEAQRISSHVARVSGIQDEKATNDAIATGVAIVVFWPAAFLISGNDQNTAELARLKGEMEAIERVSTQKNCGIQFRRAPASTPSPARKPDAARA